MDTITAFLFEGPCDGETMSTCSNAKRIEIAVLDKKETHVYHVYSTNIFGGKPCRIFKFMETIPND